MSVGAPVKASVPQFSVNTWHIWRKDEQSWRLWERNAEKCVFCQCFFSSQRWQTLFLSLMRHGVGASPWNKRMLERKEEIIENNKTPQADSHSHTSPFVFHIPSFTQTSAHMAPLGFPFWSHVNGPALVRLVTSSPSTSAHIVFTLRVLVDVGSTKPQCTTQHHWTMSLEERVGIVWRNGVALYLSSHCLLACLWSHATVITLSTRTRAAVWRRLGWPPPREMDLI